MNDKDRVLSSGCLRSEKAAWDAFVLQYSNLVYHTIRKTLTLHHTDTRDEVVEDLYQEFFVSIVRDDFKKLRQFRGDRNCTLASWLRVVASRLTIDFLRKQSARDVKPTETLVSHQPESPDPMFDQEKEKFLSQALENLSPRDRLIIQLTYHQALSPEDIAAILRVSVSAFYTQKSRILNKLRAALEKLAV